MLLGSHNSWSYLPVAKWYMKPFAFMAKCQEVDIREQYETHRVRCFDLRVKFDNNNKFVLAHGSAVYKYDTSKLLCDLNYINSKEDCYVRVIHEVRKKKEHTDKAMDSFSEFCNFLMKTFKHTKFWCGRNLYNWEYDYIFWYSPTCEEKYASVCSPKLIDDWYPKLFAKRKNKAILEAGTGKEILLIDFVNIK